MVPESVEPDTLSRARRESLATVEDTIELSGTFLSWLSPARVALAGLLVYLAIATLGPIQPTVDPSLSAIVYVGLCYLTFIAGVAICGVLGGASALPARLRVRGIEPGGFWLVITVAAIGIALRLVDRLVLREIPFGDEFAAVREQLQATEPSLVSAIGAALYPTSFAALMAYYLLPERRRGAFMAIATYLVFLYPAAEAALQGSRSLLLISFGFVWLTRRLIPGSVGGERRSWLFWGASALLLVAFILIFQLRLEAAGTDLVASSQFSGYAFTVPPSPWIRDLETAQNPLVSIVAAAVLHVTQYYAHSGYELMYIFDRLPDQPLYGAYNFFHLVKFVSLITGDTSLVERAQNVDIRTGVFATFFVPLFVDFGWAGIIVMAGFGYACTALWQLASRRPGAWYPLFSYMTIVVFLIPITSFVVAAQGLYIIVALTMLGFALTLVAERSPGSAATSR